MKNTKNPQHPKNPNHAPKADLNAANNVLHIEMTEVDLEAATKTLEEETAEDLLTEAEDTTSATVVAIEETDAVEAVAVARTGDQTDVHLKVKPHPKFKEIYQVKLEDGSQRLATKN